MAYPANTADILALMYPAAVPNQDYRVHVLDGVTDIAYWSASLGTQPTDTAVTTYASGSMASAQKAAALHSARDIRNCFTDAEIKRVQLEAKTDTDVELILTKLNTMGDHRVRGDSATLVGAHTKLASIADVTMASGTLAPAALTAIVSS